MSASDTIRYLEPTPKAGWLFMQRGFEGSVVMLNLLRFREMAAFEQIINAQHADQPSWCRPLIGKYASLAPFAPEPYGQALRDPFHQRCQNPARARPSSH